MFLERGSTQYSVSVADSCDVSCDDLSSRGEEGYFCMQHRFAWAKRPMLHRIGTDLNPDLPVSIIYGTRSWVYSLDKSVMEQFSGARPEGSYVGTYLVDDATHHVHAHKPEEFNETVREILEIVDSSADLLTYCSTST